MTSGQCVLQYILHLTLVSIVMGALFSGSCGLFCRTMYVFKWYFLPCLHCKLSLIMTGTNQIGDIMVAKGFMVYNNQP